MTADEFWVEYPASEADGPGKKNGPSLLIKVPVEIDEPLHGWLFKASELRRFPTPDRVGRMIGARFQDILANRKYLPQVAELLSADLDAIEHRAPLAEVDQPPHKVRERQLVRYWGHRLSTLQFRPGQLWVCPYCLVEKKYLRNVWDLVLCGLCHIHACALVSHCPSCQSRLNYRRQGFVHCCTGHDLRRIKPAGASVEAVQLWRYIDDRLNSRDVSPVPGVSDNDQLRNLSLEGLLQLVLVLGSFAPGMRRKTTMADAQMELRSLTADKVLRVSETAAALIFDWPLRFQSQIAEAMKALPRGGANLRQGIQSGSVLLNWALPEELSFLDRIVEESSRKRVTQLLSQRRAGNGESGRSQVPAQGPVNSAATLDAKGLLACSVTSADPESTPYDVVPVADAAVILGTEVRSVLELFASWHTSRRLGPTGKPVSPRVVLREPVVRLWEEINARQNPWTDDPTSQYRNLEEAQEVSWKLGGRLDELLDRMRAGDIRFCAPRGIRFAFQNTLLNDTDLLRWWRDLAATNGRDKITVYFARRMMSLDTATFSRLVSLGQLGPDLDPRDEVHSSTSTEIILDALERLRLLRRVEEFCGVRAKEFAPIISTNEVILLTGGKHEAHQVRERRIVAVSDLKRPSIYEFLQSHARQKWLP